LNKEFTHFDEHGNAIMVDVSSKDITSRIAKAEGTIYMDEETLDAIMQRRVKKGDVLGVARVAGIMAVKNTSNMIPMCHPLQITGCLVDFEIDEENYAITAYCTVKVKGQTGVEMEALTGVSTALLTIYDMCKSISKEMVISEIMLLNKTGGKSGTYSRDNYFNQEERDDGELYPEDEENKDLQTQHQWQSSNWYNEEEPQHEKDKGDGILLPGEISEKERRKMEEAFKGDGIRILGQESNKKEGSRKEEGYFDIIGGEDV